MDIKKKKESLLKLKKQLESSYQQLLGQLSLIEEMEKEEKIPPKK